MTDESLPKNGPGRADDGNFVLSEFKVRWADATVTDEPDFEDVELTAAQADFSEAGHGVREAIDGRSPSVQNGWAIAPQTGKAHTAIFKVKDELNPKPLQGAILKLSFVQNFNTGKHALGRFRLSVTDSTEPLDFGLPKDIQHILATDSTDRSDQQRKQLTEFFRGRDGELERRKQELDEAKQPLPKDEKLTKLEQQLAEAQKPIVIDPDLVRLRQEVKTSEQQPGTKRLTATQDISWALINNPEFLFNH